MDQPVELTLTHASGSITWNTTHAWGPWLVGGGALLFVVYYLLSRYYMSVLAPGAHEGNRWTSTVSTAIVPRWVVAVKWVARGLLIVGIGATALDWIG